MLIQLSKVSKNFGGMPIFDHIDLVIHTKDKIGLIGANESGKTTMLKLLSGDEQPDQGTVSKKKGLKIGYIEQTQENSELQVLDYVLESFEEINRLKVQLRKIELEMTNSGDSMEALLNKYGKIQENFEALGGFSIEERIITTLRGLGLEDKIEHSVNQLSGGERVRVELVKLLVSDSDLLILDEPTNHLDLAGIKWLENYLKNTKQPMMIVSHDRAFLDQVVQRIVEIEDGQLVEYAGNYSVYQRLKAERVKQLQKDYDLQQKEIARLKKLIRQFRHWGNIHDNEKFYRKAKELEHRLERMEKLSAPVEIKKRVKKEISQSKKMAKEVIIAENIGKIIGEKLLFEASNFIIYRGERIALVGENGSGKSTLLKMILEEISTDEGRIKKAESLSIGYLPQQINFSNPNQRVVEYVKNLLGNEQKAREELARFGFYASDVSKRLKDLSGGEKVRLYLLKIFQKEISLLILDEPTNHLDIYAREEVEGIIRQYGATLIAVSHDRYFLKKIMSKTLLIKDSKIEKQDQLFLD